MFNIFNMKVATYLVRTWISYHNNWLDIKIYWIPLFKELKIILDKVYVFINNSFR